MDKKVMILDAERPTALNFMRYYKSLGYKVISGAPHKRFLGSFSRFGDLNLVYPPTGYLSDYGRGSLCRKDRIYRFQRWVREVTKRYQIEEIISLSEITLIPLLRAKDELLDRNLYPEKEAVNLLHDKSLLFENIKRFCSFKIPEIMPIGELNFPCVIRPKRGISSSHVYFCQEEDEVLARRDRLRTLGRTPLIQKYIEGDFFVTNLLVGREGSVKRGLVFSDKVKSRIGTILEELEGFFASIGYYGPASPQFIVNNGELFLVEINPRLSDYYYGLDFGINFPQGVQCLLDGKEIDRKIKFLPEAPRMLKASYNYLKGSKDVLPVIKSAYHHFRASMISR